jgi:ABC-2 type transport system permease protein
MVALVAMQAFVQHHDRVIDLTAEHSLTLTHQTRDLVRKVHRSVRISAFLRRAEPGRAEEAALLDRYHRLNRHIGYRVLDPDDSPGEIRRLNVDPAFGGMALEMADRVERADTVTEQDVTGGLARLLRGKGATLCVTAGHGEPGADDSTDGGFSLGADLLRRDGYRVNSIDLLIQPSVPADCEVLLIQRPLAPLGQAEVSVAGFLAGGGRALVLTDPVSTIDLSALLAPYGVKVNRGLVFERDDNARLSGDSLTPVVSSFAGGSPIARRLPPVVFPSAQALTTMEDTGHGLAVTAFARTTARAYLTSHPAEAGFDPRSDTPGPLTLAAAADRSAVLGARVQRTRIVVTADADFAANGWIAEAGNSRLLLQAADWASLQEDLVSISANLAVVRPLALTGARRRYLISVMAGIVPALFVLAGAMVWAIRRPR